MKKNLILLVGILISSGIAARANVIADWTFDTTIPKTAGPIAPEIGHGSASAVGLTSITGTSGNPSSGASFSGPGWNVGDYWQFQVSTVGFENITISYDQEGSATGPATFLLEYSTNGTSFTPIGSNYSLGSVASKWVSTTGNLSLITDSDNSLSLYFRVVDNATTTIGGGAPNAAGTSRIDNVIISGDVFTAPVPEPSSLALVIFGGFACLWCFRRKPSLN